jgi:hypothetical protein
MARKIRLVSNRLSGLLLRLTGMAIAFLFSAFVHASGQIITAAGKCGAAVKRQSIVPAYAFIADSTPVSRFSAKGVIESSVDSTAIATVKVTLRDTASKQVLDSTITNADGMFFMTVTNPSPVLHAFLHVDRIARFFGKDTLLSIPAGDTANVQLRLYSAVPVYGCPPASATSGMANVFTHACRLGAAIEVRYSLSAGGQTRLSLFKANGTLVTEVFCGREQAGDHEARMETAGLPGGMYYLLLRAGGYVAVTKIAVID